LYNLYRTPPTDETLEAVLSDQAINLLVHDGDAPHVQESQFDGDNEPLAVIHERFMQESQFDGDNEPLAIIQERFVQESHNDGDNEPLTIIQEQMMHSRHQDEAVSANQERAMNERGEENVPVPESNLHDNSPSEHEREKVSAAQEVIQAQHQLPGEYASATEQNIIHEHHTENSDITTDRVQPMQDI
jgi:hypothetical protein